MAALLLPLLAGVLLLACTTHTLAEYPILGLMTSESTAVFPLKFSESSLLVYYVSMMIGNPTKQYDMNIDTGSDLTVVNCTYNPNDVHPPYEPNLKNVLRCDDEQCKQVRKALGMEQDCETGTECRYQIRYADRSGSDGLIVSDDIALTLRNNPTPIPAPLVFGCETSHKGESHGEAGMDGLVGLGSTYPSLMSQLKGQGGMKDAMGHCLARSRSSGSGGYLFLGNADQLVPSGTAVSWATMQQQNVFYTMETAAFHYGDKQLTGTNRELTLLDSGSTFTYFVASLYETFVQALEKDLSSTPAKMTADEKEKYTLCWKNDDDETTKYFKNLAFDFTAGGTEPAERMEIPPENYLFLSDEGNLCLGILKEYEDDSNLIGAMSMQDVLVMYDNEKKQIGWAPTDCSKTPLGDATSSPI